MTTTDKHYLEMHVVVRAANPIPVKATAKTYGWWSSEIEKDDGEDDPGSVFFTKRVVSMECAQAETQALITKIRLMWPSTRVIRYKVEEAVVDSNLDDVFKLDVGRLV